MAKGVKTGGVQKGWRKPEGVRGQHQIRAYDDEWEIIRGFSKWAKSVGQERAQKALDYVRENM